MNTELQNLFKLKISNVTGFEIIKTLFFLSDRGEPAVLPLHEPSHCGAWCLRHHRGVGGGAADHWTAQKPGISCQDAAARCLQQDVFGRQRPPESHQWISQCLTSEVQVTRTWSSLLKAAKSGAEYGFCHLMVFVAQGLFLLFGLYRRFFLAACDVPSLEDKFNVDQYSDLVTVSKPVIYISIGEMINTHTVSLDHISLTSAAVKRDSWKVFTVIETCCFSCVNLLLYMLVAVAGPSGCHCSRAQWSHPWAARGPGGGSYCRVSNWWVNSARCSLYFVTASWGWTQYQVDFKSWQMLLNPSWAQVVVMWIYTACFSSRLQCLLQHTAGWRCCFKAHVSHRKVAVCVSQWSQTDFRWDENRYQRNDGWRELQPTAFVPFVSFRWESSSSWRPQQRTDGQNRSFSHTHQQIWCSWRGQCRNGCQDSAAEVSSAEFLTKSGLFFEDFSNLSNLFLAPRGS